MASAVGAREAEARSSAEAFLDGAKSEIRLGRFRDGYFPAERAQVKDWVEVNRDALQTPELLAGDEALAKSISLAAAQPALPPPENTPRAPNLEELVPAWRDFQELSTQHRGPAPWVYSPHVWRIYQETLLRYEQLLRAGDPTHKVVELKKSLARWKDEIERAQDFAIRMPRLCTVRLTRRLVPELARRSLDALMWYFGLETDRRHRASGDAEVTAYALLRLLKRARMAGLATWEELQQVGN